MRKEGDATHAGGLPENLGPFRLQGAVSHWFPELARKRVLWVNCYLSL